MRITATPLYDCDSMCSMSLTVVVSARSLMVTMRFSISSAETPGYAQIRLTTGISMVGKMSVGIVTIAAPPSMAIRIDMTTKV